MRYVATIRVSIEAPSSQLAEEAATAIVESDEVNDAAADVIYTLAAEHRNARELKPIGAHLLHVIAAPQR